MVNEVQEDPVELDQVGRHGRPPHRPHLLHHVVQVRQIHERDGGGVAGAHSHRRVGNPPAGRHVRGGPPKRKEENLAEGGP